MDLPQLITFINQQLATGAKREDIERILLANQVKPEEVAAAFNSIGLQDKVEITDLTKPPTPAAPTPVKSGSGWGWFFATVLLIVLLVISGAGAYIYYLKPDLISQVCQSIFNTTDTSIPNQSVIITPPAATPTPELNIASSTPGNNTSTTTEASSTQPAF